MSDPEGTVSFVFPRVLMFPKTKSRETVRTRGKTKLTGFPRDLGCLVIFLEFHFNSNKRINEANKNSRLGTYKNTNFILKPLNERFTKYFLCIICIFFLH